jgi:hypothetical protein
MQITVKSTNVKEEIFRKTGEVSRKQWAFLRDGEMEFPFLVGIGDDKPYAPGNYSIDPESFAVNEYHKLTMKSYVRLVPVAVSK